MRSPKQAHRMRLKARRRGRRNCRAGRHEYTRKGIRIAAIDQARGIITVEPDPDAPMQCAWCGLSDWGTLTSVKRVGPGTWSAKIKRDRKALVLV